MASFGLWVKMYDEAFAPFRRLPIVWTHLTTRADPGEVECE